MSSQFENSERPERLEAFRGEVVDLITKNLDDFKSSDDVRDRAYEAHAVQKLFSKLVEQARQKEPTYSDVLIRKFLAYELLRFSQEADITAPGIRWQMMFVEENPEPASPDFLLKFKDLLDTAVASIDTIKRMDFIVLFFDRELFQKGNDPRRAIRSLVDKSENGIKQFCSQYGYEEDDFYRIALEFVESRRNSGK